MNQVLDYENDFNIAIKTSINKLKIKAKELVNSETFSRKYIMYKGKLVKIFEQKTKQNMH